MASSNILKSEIADILRIDGIFKLGSGPLPRFAMCDTDLSIDAKAIYSYLCSYAGSGNTQFPSRETILADLDIGKDRYYNAYNQLIDNEYIRVEQSRVELSDNNDLQGYGRNIYTINNYPKKYVESKAKRQKSTLRLKGVFSNGFGFISKLAMKDDRLDIKAKAIYSYLCSFAGNEDSCYPEQAVMIKHLDIAEKTFAKYFKQLKEFGYISVVQRLNDGKRFGVNDYYINDNPTVSPYSKNKDTHLEEPYSKNKDTQTEIPYGKFPDTQNPDTQNKDTGKNNNIKSNLGKNLYIQENSLKEIPFDSFAVPSQEQFEQYCQQQNITNVEWNDFSRYYEAVNWTDPVTQMKVNWVQKLLMWSSNDFKKKTDSPKSKKQSEPVVPTLEEVKAYAKEQGRTDEESTSFFEYYDGNGWKTKKGNAIRKWQSYFEKWKKYENKPAKKVYTLDEMEFSEEDMNISMFNTWLSMNHPEKALSYLLEQLHTDEKVDEWLKMHGISREKLHKVEKIKFNAMENLKIKENDFEDLNSMFEEL